MDRVVRADALVAAGCVGAVLAVWATYPPGSSHPPAPSSMPATLAEPVSDSEAARRQLQEAVGRLGALVRSAELVPRPTDPRSPEWANCEKRSSQLREGHAEAARALLGLPDDLDGVEPAREAAEAASGCLGCAPAGLRDCTAARKKLEESAASL